MNLLYLIRYFLSKRKVQECILLLQLICMIVFSFVVLSPIDEYFQKYSALSNTYQSLLSSAYHFSEGNALMQNEKSNTSRFDGLYEKFMSVTNVENVFRFSMQQASFDIGESEPSDHNHNQRLSKNANLFVYSDEMAKELNLELDAGEFLSYYDGVNTPILISSSLSDKFQIGSTVDLYVGIGRKKMSCIVTGVFSEHAAIPCIHNYGSSPSLDILAAYTHTMPEHDFIVACYNDQLLNTISWGQNFLITVQDDANMEQLKQDLERIAGTYGTVKPVSYIIKQSFYDMIKNNRWYIFAFTLLSAIAVFGYGGYMFLLIRRNQREFALFYILGMQRKQIAAIIFIMGSILLLSAAIVAYAIYPWFTISVLGETHAQPGVISLIFCGGLLFAILIVSIISGFMLSAKTTTVALYNGGD